MKWTSEKCFDLLLRNKYAIPIQDGLGFLHSVLEAVRALFPSQYL